MQDRPEIVDPSDWAPEACTLPTAERPLRVAEFDELFTALLRFDRPQPTLLELVLPREAEATGRDHANRESQCCSFFVGVPSTQVGVLDSLQARLEPLGDAELGGANAVVFQRQGSGCRSIRRCAGRCHPVLGASQRLT